MYIYSGYDYEAEQQLKSLAQYTESGNATWRITDYNPIIGIPSDDDATPGDDASAVCHTIKATGFTPDGTWHVGIMESIYLLAGKGDISIHLSDDYSDSQFILSANKDYNDCTAENIISQFKDSPILIFAQIVLPVLAEAIVPIFSSYTWYDFPVPDVLSPADKRRPIFRITKKLARERRVLDFHKMVFDTDFRKQLKAELP